MQRIAQFISSDRPEYRAWLLTAKQPALLAEEFEEKEELQLMGGRGWLYRCASFGGIDRHHPIVYRQSGSSAAI